MTILDKDMRSLPPPAIHIVQFVLLVNAFVHCKNQARTVAGLVLYSVEVNRPLLDGS